MRPLLTITIIFGVFLAARLDETTMALWVGLAQGGALDSVLSVPWMEGIPWTEWMRRSLFEGNRLGVGDLPILLQIACAIAYAWSLRPSASVRLKAWRPALASLVIAALVTAGWVHLTKGIMARPRPYVVRSGAADFHPFFDLTVPELFAFGRGSFPSGHTATMMTLWTGVSILAWRRAPPVWVGVYALFCLLGAGLMAYSRVLLGDHWPTDTVGSIIGAGLLGQLVAGALLVRPWSLAHEKEDLRPPASVLRRDLGLLGLWVMRLLVYGGLLVALRLLVTGYLWTGGIVGLLALGGCYGLARPQTVR